ncbi:MAG: TPM domain-containing protein [Kiritimatiellae bacterium]|nr:TPM domain-containing protein [Kiritimatiellia bacterium]
MPKKHPVRRAIGTALVAGGLVLFAAEMALSCSPSDRGKVRDFRASHAVRADDRSAYVGVVPDLPEDFVLDAAGTFSEEGHAAVAAELAALETATGGGQMAVAVFSTLSGADPHEAALRIARTWALGRKGVDDGALLLIAVEDREIRLEIGLGWEGVIPDSRAGGFIDSAILELKNAKWADAAVAIARDVRAAVSGETLPARKTPEEPAKPPLGVLGLFAAFIGLMLRDESEGSGGRAVRGGGGGCTAAGNPSFRGPSPRPVHRGGGGRFGGGGAGRRF